MKWPKVLLGEIADIQMGQSPPGETYNENGEGLPFFQGKIDFGDRHPRARKWCAAPLRVAEAGDILLSVRAPVGPTNLADQRCCIGRGLAALKPRGKLLDPEYLWFFLRFIEPALSARGQGSTFTAINRSDIERLSVFLPPLSEQRRIVEVLDQADALRKKRAEADTKAARILPALFYKMFGDPASLVADRSVKPLGELVYIVSGATPSKQVNEYWQGDIPWISPKEMKGNYIHGSSDHISSTALQDSNLKLISPGAILIVVREMILAHHILFQYLLP